MEQISLQGIQVQNNRVEYRYTVTDGLKSYFCLDIPYFIEYTVDDAPLDLQNVPPSVLAVPFVCNVLPIVWLTNAELVVPDLDKDFFDSIPEFKQGFINMYSDASFEGTILAGKITKNLSSHPTRSSTFFSGGLDAWCTLIRHIKEKPDLIAVWGADITPNNNDGWNTLLPLLRRSAEEQKLPLITIHSTFRKFLNEGELDKAFYHVLKDGWWHAAQNGLGLIGHAAPCNFVRNVSTQYIAASYCPEDGFVRDSSSPSIDNFIRYCGCHVVHDAFISRPQKTKEIIQYCKENNRKISMHVCWQSTTGENCCHCEKCYRTIMGFLVEGANPQDYNFPITHASFESLKYFIKNELAPDPLVTNFWKQLQSTFIENKSMLRTKPYYNDIKWIETFDFDHPERYWKRRLKRAAGYPRIFARKVKGKLKHVLGK